MRFQTYYKLDPMSFEPPILEVKPSRVSLGSNFSLELRESDDGGEDRIFLVLANHERELPETVADVFGRRTEPTQHSASADGLSEFPSDYREFVTSLHAFMDQTATQAFNVLRWRLGIRGGPLDLSSEWYAMRWQNQQASARSELPDGYLNSQIPAGVFTLSLPPLQRIALTPDIAEEVAAHLAEDRTQPLYHDLLREAVRAARQTPRSALVMAITALETGFKTTAIDLCGSDAAAWIIEHLQTPPLERLIRDCLPLLPSRATNKLQELPKTLIAVIRGGVELRNKLVHGRAPAISAEMIDELIETVWNVLYLFDYHRGNDWALANLAPALSEVLYPDARPNQ